MAAHRSWTANFIFCLPARTCIQKKENTRTKYLQSLSWHDATALLGLHVMPVSLNTEILSVLRQTSILTIKYFVFGNESRRVELADGRPTA
jgi:hypothetical protein